MSSVRIKLGRGAARHPDRELQVELGAPTAVPPVQTLGELLEHWSAVRPSAACAYFIDLDDNITRRSWGELRDHAHRVAVGLQAAGVRPDDRVVLALPTSPELLEAFFACQLLGALPCIVEPPAAGRGFAQWCERTATKLGLVEPRLMVTGPALHEAVAAGLQQAGTALAVRGVDTLPADGEITANARAGASAILQFTSGTTSSPKAVTCSHRAVLANVRCVGGNVRQFREGDLMVGWLPLFHDMGLVATALAALAHGLPVALMPPAAFVLRPARWLWAMHVLRASLAFAPNFAYRLCLRRLPDGTPDLDGLDLSSWRIAFNAAEFIHADAARSFTTRFSSYGFPAHAMTPAYGMAEMAVGVSSHEVATPLQTETISRTVLGREGRARPTDPESADALEIVSVGRVFVGHELEIHDEDGRALDERREGQIVIRGPSLFDGYYRNEPATSEALRAGWLQTGDLGYLVEGRLFITGRSKDLIIRGGENHHPHLLEAAAQDAPGVRGGRVAAVGLANAEVGTEDIALIVETTEREAEAMERIRFDIESRVHRVTGLRPDRVVLVPPNTIPVTTSGKVRRGLARQELLRRLTPPNGP